MVIQKCEKSKIFQKLPDTICVRKGEKRAFSCTLSVLARKCFGPKTVQTRKHYNNSGFSGICPKPTRTPFFGKGVFGMGEKVGFTNCVFEKLRSFWKHNFTVFSEKRSSCNTNTVCNQKNRKLMKNSGLLLNMAKGCFYLSFFQALMSLYFLSGKVARVLKMFVFFPMFWVLWGGFFLFIWVWKVWKVWEFLCFLFLLFF